MNTFNQMMKRVMLGSLVCLLSACQLLPQNNQPVSDYTLPTVEPKYSTEEIADFNHKVGLGNTNQYEGITIRETPILKVPANLPKSLFYDSGINIAYPQEGVKGLYLTAEIVADTAHFQTILNYVDETALNALVIDFKSDSGAVTTQINTNNPLVNENIRPVVDMPAVLKTLEQHQIYPIARIVTFKDYLLAENHPELSFKNMDTGELWSSDHGDLFINPFLKETWDYNIDIAIEAAKMGFKEIQFDYVRFAEGFETFGDTLQYDKGLYSNYSVEPILDANGVEVTGAERVAAITDFLKYARERLAPYGVKVSADVFGYTAIAGTNSDAVGIGQNFIKIAEQVDVISSMIYPSHWGPGFFGIEDPNASPFDTVDEYMASEALILKQVNNPVVTRPWLQDFSDGYPYYAAEVQDQINALHKHGIHEFLLWNISGEYTTGVDYMPEMAH
ncbi:MAG: putative glycoside hydrolase [Aerococcaceae bacterium]|nr:putative glycoside hydrolase [Aerococcaceae bacterium]